MKRFFFLFVVCFIANGALAQDQLPKQPKFLLIKGIREDANYVLQSKDPDKVLKQEKIDDYDFQTVAAVQERAANGLQKIKQLFDSGTPEGEEVALVTGKTT